MFKSVRKFRATVSALERRRKRKRLVLTEEKQDEIFARRPGRWMIRYSKGAFLRHNSATAFKPVCVCVCVCVCTLVYE